MEQVSKMQTAAERTSLEGEEMGLVIERRFTKAGGNPFASFDWVARRVVILDNGGKTTFSLDGVVLPAHYSINAGNILAHKYLRKAGVAKHLRKVHEEGVPDWLQRSEPDKEMLESLPSENRFGLELDSRDLFRRLSGTWTYWGWKHGYFQSELDARAYFDEMCYMLANQMGAPNSPQWFNTGLHWAYGIKGESQGHYYVDPTTEALTKSDDAYEHPQPHACFIQSVKDDLVNDGGIMNLWTREARLFKFGSGTGSNFSSIRGEGEPLSGGGHSSGLMSFLKIGDSAAGAIRSGGTTRRAAKMVILDMDHPDIESFINWKVEEEEKVAALVTGSKVLKHHANEILGAMWSNDKHDKRFDVGENKTLRQAVRKALQSGVPDSQIHRIMELGQGGVRHLDINEYDTSWQGEGYATVSGQNSNNSVRMSNSFIKAVEANDKWNLYSRMNKASGNSEAHKTVQAAELWDQVAKAAWSCADPGIQFDDTINEWHTCPNDGRINASNPCSEYMFLDDTACNLASLNVVSFYDDDSGKFDVADYRHAVRLWTLTLELSVTMAQFPSKSIAQRSYDYRTLGLGFTNLGSLLMRMGIPYADQRGLAIGGALSAIMGGDSYLMSAELASFLEPFSRYEDNKEDMLRVISNHHRAAFNRPKEEYERLSVKPKGLDSRNCPPELLEAARDSWDRALVEGRVHGFRNAQVTAIAPTGTISFVMDCDTTGIEPDYALLKYKSLAGGGAMRIVNQSVPQALDKLGYNKQQQKDIITYLSGTGTLNQAPHINQTTLSRKGLSDIELAKLENSVTTSFSLRGLFSPFNFDRSFLTDELKISEDSLKDPNFDLLDHFGFSEAEVEAADIHVFGRMTVEGAPHLREEDLAVFDCAAQAGKDGKRSIHWRGHISMMGAVQPYVSGAISKTVNMPHRTTPSEVKEAYEESWKWMNKSCSIYRDGSKLSQPVMSNSLDLSSLTVEKEEPEPPEGKFSKEKAIRQLAREIPHPDADVISRKVVTKYIAKRRKLPGRRGGYTQKAKVGGHTVYLHTGEYEDGGLGEIFLDLDKEGAAFRSLMNSFARAISLGLQHGVPLDEFVDSFLLSRFEPSGMVIGHPNIKRATSIIDYIFRDLSTNYLDDDDLKEPGPEDMAPDTVGEADPKPTKDKLPPSPPIGGGRDVQLTLDGMSDEIEEKPNKSRPKTSKRNNGYAGDPCPDCGQFTLRAVGTCYTCESCGATTGCS